MARAIDKQTMLDLIIEAKRMDPETGSFSEWLAEYLVDHLPTLTPPNEWVSVEDRLPDTDGAYLVYAPTYTGGSSSSLDCIGGIMFSRFKHEKWSIESGYYKRPNCVAHWMPIPAPPGKDNNVPTKAQNEPLSIEQFRQGSTPKESYINYCMHCGVKIDN